MDNVRQSGIWNKLLEIEYISNDKGSVYEGDMLPNQAWVRSPACGKANLVTPGCGEGKYSVYCKAPNVGPSKNGQLVPKRLELPSGF